MTDQKQPLRYQDAGVDIAAGDALVDAIKPHAKSTARAGMMGGLGGFGGLFDLKAAGFSDPILVAATDGVGTKLKLAEQTGLHYGLGIDLVAMCANDLLAQGALPLFFLDYFATGKLDPKVAEEIVAGIADGCRQAGAGLIGGETAEMPDHYAPGSYDLAGFCVGAAERGQMLDPSMVVAGDQVIALPSSGVHANGFSLVRKLIERAGAALDAPAPYDQSVSLAESLMAPTRIYTSQVQKALQIGGLHGLAHITGGGLVENPPRCYEAGLSLRLDMAAYEMPALFSWMKDEAAIDFHELARTFNCGIGALLFVAADTADEVLSSLRDAGEAAWLAGIVEERGTNPAAIFDNLPAHLS